MAAAAAAAGGDSPFAGGPLRLPPQQEGVGLRALVMVEEARAGGRGAMTAALLLVLEQRHECCESCGCFGSETGAE